MVAPCVGSRMARNTRVAFHGHFAAFLGGLVAQAGQLPEEAVRLCGDTA
jgi:hypothetical protein